MTTDKTIYVNKHLNDINNLDCDLPYVPLSELTDLQTKLDVASEALEKIGNYVNGFSNPMLAIGGYAALQIIAKEALDKIKGIK